MYKGPWKVPANKRTPKDPSAPKRPMSAFLAFSNKRRAALKRQTPEATNADLSKMLSKTWKEAPEELRRKYMDEEAGLRAKYKVEMAKWRKKVAEEKKAERKERESMAMQAAEALSTERANAGGDGRLGDQSALQHQQLAGLGGSGMYGNPFGGGLPNELSGLSGLQGSGFPGVPGLGGFGGQGMMGGNPSQQQLINQLLANQSAYGGVPSGLGQRGGLGMFGGSLPGAGGNPNLGGFAAGGGNQGDGGGGNAGGAMGGFPYGLPTEGGRPPAGGDDGVARGPTTNV